MFVGRTFVNAELVKAVLARVLNMRLDQARAEELQELEQQARRKRKGLWQENNL